MYNFRKLTPAQQAEIVEYRRQQHLPWHSPPHWDLGFGNRYLISAACFEHVPIIGQSYERMSQCEEEMLTTCRTFGQAIFAWCVLPNHYHVIVETEAIKTLCRELGKFHGRSSHRWNGEDNCRGRQVWYRCFDRQLRSDRHFWASVNYVHHNPVHHGYVDKWQDWPWSSAKEFLERFGREKAEAIWREYPILDYGKDWDI